ncbi:MAG: hypothetical protein FWG63_06825 [Defluviitaleaceae bacterium]|nr:hypothetical protein [Defluviitaleaceae bacterium]
MTTETPKRKTFTSPTVKDRYNKKVYDYLPIRVYKGQKDILKAHAAARGESLNGFVNRCIDEGLARDNAALPTATNWLEEMNGHLSQTDDEPLNFPPRSQETRHSDWLENEGAKWIT